MGMGYYVGMRALNRTVSYYMQIRATIMWEGRHLQSD